MPSEPQRAGEKQREWEMLLFHFTAQGGVGRAVKCRTDAALLMDEPDRMPGIFALKKD